MNYKTLKAQSFSTKITIQSSSPCLCINVLRGAMTAFKLLNKLLLRMSYITIFGYLYVFPFELRLLNIWYKQ